MRRKPLGVRGENFAARFLRAQGYRILDRNVQLGKYEIDIIAQDGDTIAFVEVKTRETADPVKPEENVDREKERGVILLNRGAPLHRRITPILLRFSIKFPLSNVNWVVAIMFKQTPIGLLIWIFMRDNCPENGYNGTIARKAA